MNDLPTAARLPELAGALPAPAAQRQRRISLRATGVLAILALIALATVMVASAFLFRGAVQSHLMDLEAAHGRYEGLLEQRQEALRAGADRARVEAVDLQLRSAFEERLALLNATRHYIDGSTVTIATLAWIGITSIGALAVLFFARLAGDINTVRARALAILTGDRSAGRPLARSDELRELGDAVDSLAAALSKREQALAVERRHVMHQEKLATIGSMAAGVIREIGNPIAAIDGYARALLEAQKASPAPAPQPDDESSGVRPILQETARLIAITREINRLAAAPAAQWQLASLNEVVTQGLALLRYEPRLENVKVHTELDPMLPALNCCADRLVQLLLNLVINAADATSGLPAHTARVEINTRAAEGGIELRVDDNGCGLSPEVQQHAFEPLFTTKPAGKGTGLGLPLCRAIAEEHGGRISLQALPQGGTRAAVWLPLDHQPAQ
ncbi:sensor histidine kinase [Ramlibacter sp. AN1133]|uniref:sensor histidine kinase n=1 Tax=Ramlibacter sp. AN1133 TaxID=3133429 RepID=UPI0030BB68C5